RDHLRYNLLTAQYHLPSLITFAETADHLHRNPQSQFFLPLPRQPSAQDVHPSIFGAAPTKVPAATMPP
ncbi:hypothetical protein, partial [Cupriavidus sp. SHE]|uniref:hypothetical protein n=1 Tax=Cupriavidus sp. SHE TaxID=1539143 RepID=UPI001E5AA4F8